MAAALSSARKVGVVGSLHVYPIKSCQGISVSVARVARRGFEHDRRFMVVDQQGQFVTQRSHPRLCLVSAELVSDGVVVSAPGAEGLRLPFVVEGERTSAGIWSSQVEAIESAPGGEWFSDFLGERVRLVYMPEDSERSVRGFAEDVLVSFADGYPFLMVGEASLADLNRRCPEPLEMSRFRPNIVLAEAAPHAEDQLSQCRIGGIEFVGPKLCDRCSVTTVDPTTGKRGVEPLRTLASYRRWDNKVWFGMNLVQRGFGAIKVGDVVETSVLLE